MKKLNQMVIAGLAALLLVACGSDNNVAAIQAAELHACELLPGAEVSRIAGAALIESSVDVERNAGNDAFSQCTHTLDGSRKRVTVQVRKYDAPMGMSRQSDADEMRASDDDTGYSLEFAEAIDAGTDISGLGDAAYAFEIGGTLYLVAYKDRHIEVRVWTPIGSDSNEQVLRIEKEIVQAVFDQL
jgi:hypothetical protein